MLRRIFRLLPVITLLLLSPAIGELLSGSSPPAIYFQPFTLITLVALYGSGAVIVRELVRRWHGDVGPSANTADRPAADAPGAWAAILALGAAYGIYEEGLTVKSFFDPNWMDLGILGVYGRWAGVNWVWSLELIVYHAVFSIALPILLVELMFPARRHQPWLSRRGLRWFYALIVLDGALIYFILNPYPPPAIPYLAAVGLTVWLVVLARRWAKGEEGGRDVVEGDRPHPDASHPGRARRFVLIGFAGTVGFFALNWVVPHTGIPAVLTMLLTVGWLALVTRWIGRNPGSRQLWALAAGALGFFVALSPVHELDRAARVEDPAGMGLVGVATVALLLGIAARRGFLRRGCA